jgi:hypothetical protein
VGEGAAGCRLLVDRLRGEGVEEVEVVFVF